MKDGLRKPNLNCVGKIKKDEKGKGKF